MNSVLAKICPETLCFSGTSSIARLLPDALNGWARFIKQLLLRGEKCFSSYYHAACELKLSVQRAAQSMWNSVLLSGFCLLGSFKWGVGTDPTALAKWGVWSWPKTNLRPWRSKKMRSNCHVSWAAMCLGEVQVPVSHLGYLHLLLGWP